jgi:mannosyl-glycoprotein endo-beta-N-acetylglucosaminidase
MRKIGFNLLLSFVVLFNLFFFPNQSSAYTDYSLYRIKTGNFIGEDNVKASLQKLILDTGWSAEYRPSGTSVPYYKVTSGFFNGEANVKEKLADFKSSTGLDASFEPYGDPVPYKQLVTGYFYGESNIRRTVEEFSKTTGLSASYENSDKFAYKKRIKTGEFIGESNTKQILDQFKAATGIAATYEATGKQQEFYQFTSGGFSGENYTKTVLKEFIDLTGVNATYQAVGYEETYVIQTGIFYEESDVKLAVTGIKSDLGITATYQPSSKADGYFIRFPELTGDILNKAAKYLNSKNWWYEKLPTGNKVASHFQIVSDSTLNKAALDKAMSLYNSRNWWASVTATGEKADSYFRIVTSPLTDEILKTGMDYFNQKGWWITTETTDEKFYPYYYIVTVPLLENDKMTKASNFFDQKNLWYSTQITSQTGYVRFRIITTPLLGDQKNERALNYFLSKGWQATSEFTGEKEDNFYIVTGTFQGYDNAYASASLLKTRYGWFTSIEKVQNGPQVSYTNYNLTLSEMLNLQMKQSPQTDKYRNDPAYVHSDYVDATKNKITAENVNVRNGPGTNYDVVAQLDTGFTGFKILGYEGAWAKIYLTWKDAKPEDVAYYLNPSNFPSSSSQYFQFLKLSKPAGINVTEVNEKILNTKAGVLKDKASAFAQAATQYNINELYLIAHALHETGNGTSALAKGVLYRDRVVYNMYGYGAYDSCAIECGAAKAYEQGWFTPDLAIIGGAMLIGNGYIYNTTFQQDTLYKMRWNPVTPYHQYATDIGWAAKQVTNIYNYYQLLDNYTLYIDLPLYK